LEQILEKAPDAFRTISEVADEIDVPQHVLRFWESRFPQIRPMKRGGGRRYYRPDDVDLLRGVRHLLYGEGYTIRGVQRILREQGVSFVQTVWSASTEMVLPPDVEDEDLDETGDEDAGETDVAPRAEPNLFAAVTPRAAGPAVVARTEARREPTIVPPMSLGEPSPPVQPAPPSSAEPAERVTAERGGRGSIAAHGRQKLQTALDELIACRRIIETALTDG
jgi:DNA-binding transcriptional MerR regulator